jgi:RHS repeat-associated protein
MYHYAVRANDPDGDRLTYTLTTGPAGMALDPLGRLTWSTGTADVGVHPVTITVADNQGAVVTQNYNLTVVADTQAPQVSVAVSANPADLGSAATFLVSATDNVGVQALSLTVGGKPLALDGTGHATMTASQVGQFAVVAAAFDAAGNEGTATNTLTVIDSHVTSAPDVSLTAPDYGAVVTSPVDVIGTANDPNLVSYTLEVAPLGSNSFTQIASRTQSVVNGALGKFDPSSLANDTYVLRLAATNTGGLESRAEIQVSVAGNLKLGNFTLSFTDLTVPVAGIPITITRTYDTLNANSQTDVGYGWRLAFRDVDLRTSVAPSGSENIGIYPPFRDGTRVYVTVPGGQRQGFTFQPLGQNLLGLIVYTPNFVPDPGVTSTLTLSGATTMLRDDNTGEYYSIAGDRLAFNPADDIYGAVYTLTTRNGLAYRIDAPTSQLLSVSDSNGNTLTFSDAGITSSAGQNITFQRDAQGRISDIVDPMGNKVHYQYSDQGDLVAVTDRDGHTTQFIYNKNHPHYLDQVIDPLGHTGARVEYDAQGRLTSTTDSAGNTTQLFYDPSHSTETVRDALGNPTTYEYDSQGNIVTEIDALGGITRKTYDANNNKLSETDPLGNTSTFTYDSAGNLLTQTDPLGNTTRYTYDASNRVLTTTDPLGNTTTKTLDAAGNAVMVKDPTGAVVTNSFDGQGNRTSTTDALGNVTHFQYDAAGNLTREVDALGHAVVTTYDANGDPTSQTTTRTDASGNLVTMTLVPHFDANKQLLAVDDGNGQSYSFTYNGLGQQAAYVDKNGNTLTYGFDVLGNRTTTTYPDGTDETLVYDANHNQVSSTDRTGRTTRYQYDALNRLTQIDYPDGSTIKRRYDADGQLVAMTDENGNTITYAYDADGRVTQSTDALGDTTTFSYDVFGHMTSLTDALGHITRFEYDADGRKIRTIFPDGTSQSATYDLLGRKVAESDADGNVTQFGYDALGRLTSSTDALGDKTTYAYDEVGNRVSQEDASGNITRWAYDNQGHIIKHTLPLGMSETFAYDANGNMVSHTDFNGQTATFTYDVNNRLIHDSYADGSGETFTYTATGARATVQDSGGTTTYTYDERDRLVSVTQADGTLIHYAYDPVGHVTSIGAPSGTITYTYDAANRLTSATDPDGGVTRYSYDAVGNLVSTQFSNGIAETRSYDSLDRLTGLQDVGPAGVLSGFQYTLDAAGNRIAVQEVGGRQASYAYDKLYRLLGETITDPSAGNRIITYSYDAVGNRLTRNDSVAGETVYTYDDNNRLLTETTGSDVTHYTYDANGNVLTRYLSPTDQIVNHWDARDRLIGADVTDSSGTNSVAYRYDADGQRVAQTVAGQETRFLVDENGPVAQVLQAYAPDGTVQVSYVHGQDLISQSRNGQRSFYLVDGLGSTRALADAHGKVTDRYTYDAFGRLLAVTGSTVNDYIFAGEYWDANVGLDYLRARYYDPATGRFVSPDPLQGQAAGPRAFNLYVYASNNPVNRIDPLGTQDSLSSIGVAIGVAGILASLGTGAYVTSTTLYYLGLNAGNFLTKPDAGLIGFSVTVSPAGIINRFHLDRFGVGLAIEMATLFASGVGGGDILIPRSLDRIWGYVYLGGAFGLTAPDPNAVSYSEGLQALSLSEYVGVVWNVKTPEDYAGEFRSLSPALARLGGFNVPYNATVFTGPSVGGSYGFSVASGSSTSLVASWTYYWYVGETVANLPPIDLTIDALRSLFS